APERSRLEERGTRVDATTAVPAGTRVRQARVLRASVPGRAGLATRAVALLASHAAATVVCATSNSPGERCSPIVDARVVRRSPFFRTDPLRSRPSNGASFLPIPEACP